MRLALRCLLSVLVTALWSSAQAEDLRLVWKVLPPGLDVHADRDSVLRGTDVTRITLVVVVDPSQTDRLPMSFDCAEGTYVDPRGGKVPVAVPLRWKKGTAQYAMSKETLPNAPANACEER